MYENETKDSLQKKCRDRGLPVSGNKQDIIDRLRQGSPKSRPGPSSNTMEKETKDVLQQKCRDRGLPVSGNKQDIIDRLRDSYSAKHAVDDLSEIFSKKLSLDERDKGIETGSFIVANSSGSSFDTGRNWTSEWKKSTGKTADQTCIIYSCSNDAEVGGHLKVKGRKHIAIGRICKSHNSSDKEGKEWLPTKANTTLWFLIKDH